MPPLIRPVGVADTARLSLAEVIQNDRSAETKLDEPGYATQLNSRVYTTHFYHIDRNLPLGDV